MADCYANLSYLQCLRFKDDAKSPAHAQQAPGAARNHTNIVHDMLVRKNVEETIFIGSPCDHAGCDRPPGHNFNTCWMISWFTTFLPKGQDIDEWYLWVGGGCSEGGLGVFRGRVWSVVRGVFWSGRSHTRNTVYMQEIWCDPPSSFHSFWDLAWTLQGRPWDSFYQFLG